MIRAASAAKSDATRSNNMSGVLSRSQVGGASKSAAQSVEVAMS